MALLEVEGLRVSVEDREILRGIDLVIEPGCVHAIMGPNGSGKSTLAHVIAGKPGYEVTGGTIRFDGQDIAEMEPDERAAAGIFLAFQYPVEIPGITNTSFLKHALNAQRKTRGEPEIEPAEFLKLLKAKTKALGIADEMLKRAVNVGFSGGEKKRAEVLQMDVLRPRLALLDETDSGLDIDALDVVANGVNDLRDPQRSFLVITHWRRLLERIVPDKVHVLAKGRIVASGGPELAERLERTGYAEFLEAA